MPKLVKLVLFSSVVHQLCFSKFSSLPFAIGQVIATCICMITNMHLCTYKYITFLHTYMHIHAYYLAMLKRVILKSHTCVLHNNLNTYIHICIRTYTLLGAGCRSHFSISDGRIYSRQMLQLVKKSKQCTR